MDMESIVNILFWKMWETKSCSDKEFIKELVYGCGIPVATLDKILANHNNVATATEMLNSGE